MVWYTEQNRKDPGCSKCTNELHAHEKRDKRSQPILIVGLGSESNIFSFCNAKLNWCMFRKISDYTLVDVPSEGTIIVLVAEVKKGAVRGKILKSGNTALGGQRNGI